MKDAIQLLSNDGVPIRGVTQWDINRVLRFRGFSLTTAPTIHLWKAKYESAKCVEATLDNNDVVFALPNEFVQDAFDIRCCVFAMDGTDGRTIYKTTIPVAEKLKPEDYDEQIAASSDTEQQGNNDTELTETDDVIQPENDENEGLGE